MASKKTRLELIQEVRMILCEIPDRFTFMISKSTIRKAIKLLEKAVDR